MQESSIVEHINGNPNERRQALGFLYSSDQYKKPVLSFLNKKNVPQEDQLTIWTDVVLKFSTLVINGKYQHQNKMLSFLLNLANFISLNYFRDKKRHIQVEAMDEVHEQIASSQNFIYSSGLNNAFKLIMQKMDNTCQKILSLWAQGYSMKEIMDKNQLPSVSSTRKRKHVCMKKLLSFVESRKDVYNQLLEYYNDRP